MSIENLFLDGCVARLKNCADRISVCLGKLNDDQIWARGHKTENAIGNLVLHLEGNARQWIVASLGGKPDIRVREKEFSTVGGKPAAELIQILNDVIAEATAVILNLSTEQLTRIYEIQTRKPSGLEAVLNVTTHFSEHTGQIIFATKNLTGENLGLMGPSTPQR